MVKKSENAKDITAGAAEDVLQDKDTPSTKIKSSKKSSAGAAKSKAAEILFTDIKTEGEAPVSAALGASPEQEAAAAGAAEAEPVVGNSPEAESSESAASGESCGAFYSFLSAFKPESLLTALSFLTRFGAPCERDTESLRASVGSYPLIGLAVGAVALIPVWLLPAGYFWIKAWVFVAFITWITRGLHWDGLADIADALGSNRSGAGFQEVLKDSRSGVFAILAVVFCVLGYVFAVQSLLLRGVWLPLVLAPALARCLPLFVGNLSHPHADSSLGKFLEGAVDLKFSLAWVAMLALVAVLGGYILAAILSLIVAGLILYCLLNLAERQSGYNGDFIGAGIVLVELGTLLAFVVG